MRITIGENDKKSSTEISECKLKIKNYEKELGEANRHINIIEDKNKELAKELVKNIENMNDMKKNKELKENIRTIINSHRQGNIMNWHFNTVCTCLFHNSYGRS